MIEISPLRDMTGTSLSAMIVMILLPRFVTLQLLVVDVRESSAAISLYLAVTGAIGNVP